jgi:hypothetical protein
VSSKGENGPYKPCREKWTYKSKGEMDLTLGGCLEKLTPPLCDVLLTSCVRRKGLTLCKMKWTCAHKMTHCTLYTLPHFAFEDVTGEPFVTENDNGAGIILAVLSTVKSKSGVDFCRAGVQHSSTINLGNKNIATEYIT